MNKWTSQNGASLKTKNIEDMKPEAKMLANIKIYYLDAFFDLTLIQFNNLIHALKASYDNYRKDTAAKYYKMLGIGHLRDKFVKAFFKKLE